ncbi:MBG domain-containing protein [Oleiharenicola lentus]|uniref:MBG domain-containing protein n=1 Tax=Oleiharenicola lentus TaxID=2508720 RepID=UPI003F67E473
MIFALGLKQRWVALKLVMATGLIALNAFAAPVITQQPTNQSVVMGETGSFSIVAQGEGTLAYQWQWLDPYNPAWADLELDNFRYEGVRTATLQLVSTVHIIGGTQFRCVVTNATGSTTSQAAAVSYTYPPPIIGPLPETQTKLTGSSLLLYPGVSSYGYYPTYQWQKNEQDIPGATDFFYEITSLQLGDAGRYRLVATNAIGSTFSNSSVVNVLVPAPVVSAEGGYGFSVFLRDDGSAWGVGYGPAYGQPTAAASGATYAMGEVAKVAAGYAHTLFLKRDGSLWYAGTILGSVNGQSYSAPIQIATGVVDIAAGLATSFFIKADATLWAFGRNTSGELGDGTLEHRMSPVQVASNVRQVAAGSFRSFYVKMDGTLWSVGLNQSGALGDGTYQDRRLAVQVASSVRSVHTDANTDMVAFLKTDATLWGMGALGLLLPNINNDSVPQPVELATQVSDVAVGSSHILYIKMDDTLWSRGGNWQGQLGDGSFIDRRGSVQIASGVKAVGAGANYSLFVTPEGMLWGMGNVDLSSSVRGDGATPFLIASTPLDPPAIPTDVSATGGSDFRGILVSWTAVTGAVGYEIWRNTTADLANASKVATVGLAPSYRDDTVSGAASYYYWVKATNSGGSSGYSEVVSGVPSALQAPSILQHPQNRATPIGQGVVFSVIADGVPAPTYRWQRLPTGTSTWLEIDTTQPLTYGYANTAELEVYIFSTLLSHQGDQFRCIVTNAVGSVISNSATLTIAKAAMTRVSAGRYHSLQLDAESKLFASGANTHGQLGIGMNTNSSVSRRVSIPDRPIAAVAAGAQHSLILTTDHELWVAGYNATGQLGDGTLLAKSTPFQVATEVVAIAAGVTHSAYVKTDGTLWTTGGNDSGQLGNGTTTDRSLPVQVAPDVIDVSVGVAQTYFVKFDGTLWGMGDLNGSGLPVSTPVQIASNVKSVSAGAYHAIFIKHDGTLWGVGLNNHGQLGNSTTTDAVAPVQIASGVKSASAGYFYNAYIKNDKTLWLVGRNTFGQLGDGTTTSRHVPFQLAADVRSVSASEGYTLFAKNDGTLWATGIDAQGQFGNAETATVNIPISISFGFTVAPVAPVGLAATSISAGRVRLTWQPAGNAVHYEVWRNATNDSTTATQIASGVTWAIYEDIGSGLEAAYYWIKAVNSGGTSAFSASVSPGAGLSPPVITTELQSQTVNVGTSVSFFVNATGLAPLSYQWIKGTETISGATSATYTLPSVVVTDAGDYRVVVSNSAGSATSAVATLTVNKLTQSIAFGALADRDYTLVPIALSATASSGLSVAFSVVSGPGTINGNELTLTGTGTLTVRAAQSGNATYAAASVVNRSFVISKATATVTLGGLNVTYDGSSKAASVTTNPANLSHDILYNGAQATPTNAGSYAVAATINDANYSGSASGTLVIAKATQTIEFAGPANQVFSVTPITLSATASSGLPVSLTVVSGPASVSGTTLTLTGFGTVTLRATQTGDANHEAATPVDQSFVVSSNYEVWRQGVFTAEELLNAAISGPNADPDHDGFANLVEYALGLEPKIPSTQNLPVVAFLQGEWTYTYSYSSDRADVLFLVEACTDLSAWTSVGVGGGSLIGSENGRDTVRVIYLGGSTNAVFFRLKVLLEPVTREP